MQRYKKKSPPFFASTVVVMGDVVVGKGDAVESRNGRTKRLKIWSIVSSISFLCSHLEDVESMNCLCAPTLQIYMRRTQMGSKPWVRDGIPEPAHTGLVSPGL